MTESSLLQALPLIFAVAMLYSSVGHGGASGYLAVLTLLSTNVRSFVPLVLVLNILVASISFLHFREPGRFSFRVLLPFIITSVPASYLGAMLHVSDRWFGITLGTALLLVAARIILPKFQIHERRLTNQTQLWSIALPVGFVLGLLAGIAGIGGGIFLSPILVLLGLTDIKGSAAMASAFIVVNSLAGLLGQTASLQLTSVSIALLAVAVFGALIGSRWGAYHAPPYALRIVLGSVLVLASAKMILAAI